MPDLWQDDLLFQPCRKTRRVSPAERVMCQEMDPLPGILAFSGILGVKIVGEASLGHFAICS